MANDYFEHDTKLKPGTKARAEDVNSRFDGVVTGMEKLPAPHPSLKGFSDPVAVGAPTEKEHAVSVEQALGGGISFGVDTGAVNAYVVDLPVAPVSYTVGLIISFQAVNGNTGTATIDLNGLGVKSLTRADGTILVNGDIANDQICSFVYDGSVFKATSAFAGQFSELEAAVQISADAAAVSATDAGNDAIATGLDAIATAADRVQTGLDVVATAADRVQTGLDVVATAADRVQTGLDVIAIAADRVQTGLDAATTAADRVQTNLDKIATAADLVATNQDTIDTAADKIAAEAAKTSAEAAETNILGAEPAVIAQGDTQVARVLAEGDTQVARIDVIPDPSTGTEGQALVANPALDGYEFTSLLKPTTANEWTKTQNFNATTLTDATTVAWDTESNQVTSVTLTANRIMGAPTNLVDGAFYALTVVQGAGGQTLVWNTVFKWPDATAPTLSTGAAARDEFVFRSDGTNLYEIGRSLNIV